MINVSFGDFSSYLLCVIIQQVVAPLVLFVNKRVSEIVCVPFWGSRSFYLSLISLCLTVISLVSFEIFITETLYLVCLITRLSLSCWAGKETLLFSSSLLRR